MNTTSTSILSLLLATALAACVADEHAAPLPETTDGVAEGEPLARIGKSDAPEALAATAPLPDGADIDRPLEALFAPDDPVTTLELSLIAEVVAARAADPGLRLEDHGPHCRRRRALGAR